MKIFSLLRQYKRIALNVGVSARHSFLEHSFEQPSSTDQEFKTKSILFHSNLDLHCEQGGPREQDADRADRGFPLWTSELDFVEFSKNSVILKN